MGTGEQSADVADEPATASGNREGAAADAPDRPGVRRLIDHFTDLDEDGVGEVKEAIEDLSVDPALRGALAEVATDEEAFEQVIARLPLQGTKRDIVTRFLRTYRQSAARR